MQFVKQTGWRAAQAASRDLRTAWLLGLFGLANVAIGVALAGSTAAPALVLCGLPLLLLLVAWLLEGHAHVVVLAALALPLIGGPLNQRLPGTGGVAVYPSDLLVALAILVWLLRPLARSHPVPRVRLPLVLGWPLVLLALSLMIGVIRGHDNYGSPYVNLATRIAIYAAIFTVLREMRPEQAFRGIVKVFYAGIVVQVVIGVYHLATGTSQTASVDLSTGGTRALALTTAMSLAAGLVLALLNVELAASAQARLPHLMFAGLALFGLVISFSRTAFAAAGVLVPVLFLLLRRMRRGVLAFIPLALPVAALVAAMALVLVPSLGSTLGKRLSGSSTSDPSLIQRQRKWHAAMDGFGSHVMLGFGFGRPVQFTQIDGTEVTFTGDPENSYIWLLAGGGLFTLGSLILLIVAFFADSLRRAVRTTGEPRALVVFAMSLAFIFLGNAATYPLLGSPPELLVLWVALLLPSLVAVPRLEPRVATPRTLHPRVGRT